ncbi:MAG TPA: hypothetical protein VGA96_11675 [Fibrella sp.]
MKTITIDLKSFCFGVLTMGAVLLMANKPASQPVVSPLAQPLGQPLAQPQPCQDARRFQAYVVKDNRTIIIDTQTGRFLLERPAIGLPTWQPNDFEQLYQRK